MSKVAVIMGSISDMPVMQEAIEILGFDIEIEVIVAHTELLRNYSISVKCTHTWDSVLLPVLEEQLTCLVW
jgi:phosphoribosylcarboxyaminoimidazole (NCAIR) mutase